MLWCLCVLSTLWLPAQLHAEDFRNDIVTRKIDLTTSLHKVEPCIKTRETSLTTRTF